MLRVTDIYMKAYIEAKGVECDKIETEIINGRKTVVFLFTDTEEARGLMTEFTESSFMRDYIRLYLCSKRQITQELSK